MSLRFFLVSILAFQPAAGNWIYWTDQGCTGTVVQEINQDTTDSCEASYGAYLQKVSGTQNFSSQWDTKPYYQQEEFSSSGCTGVPDETSRFLLDENYVPGLPSQIWHCNATHVWGNGGIRDISFPRDTCFSYNGAWAKVTCSQTTPGKPVAPGDGSSATRLAFAGASLLLLVLFTF